MAIKREDYVTQEEAYVAGRAIECIEALFKSIRRERERMFARGFNNRPPLPPSCSGRLCCWEEVHAARWHFERLRGLLAEHKTAVAADVPESELIAAAVDQYLRDLKVKQIDKEPVHPAPELGLGWPVEDVPDEWFDTDGAPRDGGPVWVRFLKRKFGKRPKADQGEAVVVWGTEKPGWWWPMSEGCGEPLKPLKWNPFRTMLRRSKGTKALDPAQKLQAGDEGWMTSEGFVPRRGRR